MDVTRRIVGQAERATNYLEYQMKAMRNVTKPIHVNESIASSAVLCARQVGADLIICITEAGGTARMVAKYRPMIPVVAATTIAQTANQLAANFGVVPFYHQGTDETVIRDTIRFAFSVGLCRQGSIAGNGQVSFCFPNSFLKS